MTTDDDRYRGMTSREQWEKGAVHQHSTYQCGKCRRYFATPHDLYDHLDAVHAEPKGPAMEVHGKSRYVPGRAKTTRRKTW